MFRTISALLTVLLSWTLASYIFAKVAHAEVNQEAATREAGVQAADSTHTSAEAIPRDEMERLRDDLVEAVSDRSIERVLALFDEKIVLTTQDSLNLVVIRGHEGIRDYMERTLTGPEKILNTILPNIVVEEGFFLKGTDCGVAHGSSSDHYVLSSGGEFDLATRWSASLVKRGTDWKIVNLQIASNVFDNPVFNAAKDSLVRVGSIAGGLGLIVGLLFGRLLFSRRA